MRPVRPLKQSGREDIGFLLRFSLCSEVRSRNPHDATTYNASLVRQITKDPKIRKARGRPPQRATTLFARSVKFSGGSSSPKACQQKSLNDGVWSKMLYLDDWDLIDWDHSSSLSVAIGALKASTLSLPIVGGARLKRSSSVNRTSGRFWELKRSSSVKGMNAVLGHCSSLEKLSVKRLRGSNDGGGAAELISPGARFVSAGGLKAQQLHLPQFKAKDIPGSVSKGTPDFCIVYVISKGKISSTRAASRPPPNVSPLRNQILSQASSRHDPSETQTPPTSSSKGIPRPQSESPQHSLHNDANIIK
ncbi:hypothetical protein RJ640_024880 [Escallonia rubra]|uniref:Uncharacterized protein n=1 Tax=Escallonia rubra TaxID=112253 RepID=A0AA88RI52_9ASTE|nr:hypothetical protein RJ640_024880 [Escallonia rubra]